MNGFKLFLENQTVSQYLKATNHPELKNLKVHIKSILLRNHLFQHQATKKYLDLFTNWFTYNIIKDNIDKKLMMGWATNLINEALPFLTDYIVHHINNSAVMSKFNIVGYDPREDVEQWHADMETKEATVGPPGRTLIKLDKVGMPGWKWVSLDRPSCSAEAKAAGHCGNRGYSKGDNILSLRDQEDKIHLTFIVNDKELGESKGRNNSKPSPKYHKAIVELLKSKYIDLIKGGGYEPTKNFYLDDLSEQDKESVLKTKPLIGKPKEYYLAKNDIPGLNEAFNTSIIERIDLNKKDLGDSIIVVYKDDNWSWEGLYEFLKRGSGKVDDFSWIEDLGGRDYDPGDLHYYLDSISKENMESIKKYLNSVGEDTDDILDNHDIDVLVYSAASDGVRAGTEAEASKDVRNSLEKVSDNGFYVTFDKTIEVKILFKYLVSMYDDENKDLQEYIDLEYRMPYNGYQEFDKEVFNDYLKNYMPSIT